MVRDLWGFFQGYQKCFFFLSGFLLHEFTLKYFIKWNICILLIFIYKCYISHLKKLKTLSQECKIRPPFPPSFYDIMLLHFSYFSDCIISTSLCRFCHPSSFDVNQDFCLYLFSEFPLVICCFNKPPVIIHKPSIYISSSDHFLKLQAHMPHSIINISSGMPHSHLKLNMPLT